MNASVDKHVRGKFESAKIVGKSVCAVQKMYYCYKETDLLTLRPEKVSPTKR